MTGDGPTRKAPRLEIYGGLPGEVMVYQPLAIKEISRGGALIETSVPLQVDSLHGLRLSLGDTSIVVKGRIVHSRICDVEQGGVVYRVGIEFIEPSDHVLEAIDEFMQAVVANRAESA
jgi:hypothetical protein